MASKNKSSTPSSYQAECLFDPVVDVIGKKWNLNLILEFATVIGNPETDETLSFSEIAERIPEISPRMLSMRLTFLSEEGIIEVIDNEDKPKKVRYKLSQMGLDLAFVLKRLREWSMKYNSDRCNNEICLNNECKHGIAINQIIELDLSSLN